MGLSRKFKVLGFGFAVRDRLVRGGDRHLGY